MIELLKLDWEQHGLVEHAVEVGGTALSLTEQPSPRGDNTHTEKCRSAPKVL
jgi:hypothetical protein